MRRGKLTLPWIAALALACGMVSGVYSSMAAMGAEDPGAKKDEDSHTFLNKLPEILTLFNGLNLDNWEGDKELWSVKDGEIVAKNTKPVPVSTYLLPKRGDKLRTVSDFRLTLKSKLVTSEMHSGVAFWGELAPDKGDPFTYKGHLVMFPSGWGMYDLYGRNGLPVDGGPAKKVGKQHDWNDIEILAIGSRVRVAANGVQVVDWTDPEPKRIKVGPVGLQLHSNKEPQEVRFKDLILSTFPSERLLTVKNDAKGEKQSEKKDEKK